MKIKKLEINNFRGFRQATVEFPESNLAVFIGVNGQGKSSLLDLVAMFLVEFLNKIGEKLPFPDFALKSTDIHLNESDCRNRIEISDVQADGVHIVELIGWANSIQNGNGSPVLEGLKPLREFGRVLTKLLEDKIKR